MSNTKGTSAIVPPSGGGAQSGLGEKFSPDLFTGTGNFSVPVAVPAGRNGFQPELTDIPNLIRTFYRLKILFEQLDFFENFIDEIHRVVSIFGATEVTWLSSLGSASYSAIYQSQVWENVPYEVVKESLHKEYGQPMNYQEAKKYEEDFGKAYSELDRFVVDKFS